MTSPVRQGLLVCAIILSRQDAPAQNADVPPYRRPDIPVEQRVADLLGRMTIEEKFWQLFMVPGDFSAGTEQKYSHGIFGLTIRDTDTASARDAARRANDIQRFFVEKTRLGIPIIPFDEALHGLVRAHATSFPQSIALAATWDVPLMGRVGSAVGKEAGSRGVRDVLSPVINIARDVRWGRVEETYGEDPFLCARLAAAFVGSIEREGIIATPKHMIANSGDGGRDSYPIDFDERLLDEVDFQPYLACIREGGAQSVMTSYNSLNGVPCSANPWLLKTILKGRWGFTGFVISDASAVGGLLDLHHVVRTREESAGRAIESGLDVIFQSDYDHHVPLLRAFAGGMVDTAAVNDAVSRVLTAKFRIGLFEHPYADPEEAALWNGNPAHRELALNAAQESIVLIKNDHHVLPLRKNIRSLAVIGPDAVEARPGGYSGPGIDRVTILEGIRREFGPATKIRYARGCGRVDTTYLPVPAHSLAGPGGVNGLQAEYWNNTRLSGPAALKRIDPQVDFKWTLFPPDPALQEDWFSVRWTGSLKSPFAGARHIGVQGDDGYRLSLDGRLLIDRWEDHGFGLTLVPCELQFGRRYDVRLEFRACTGNPECRLVWDGGVPKRAGEIEEAVALAKTSDAAVIVTGIEEGEFRDRADIGLPGRQAEMIRRIAETGKPVIVVIIGGSAVTMNPWIDQVAGVVDAWYPGEAGGEAVAEVLSGRFNPGGKLPVTFPVSAGQLPLVYNHKPTGRGDDYADLTGKPAFPFGFGLSYTSFAYDSLSITPSVISPGDSATVRSAVRNTGQMEGDEVVQLYIRNLVSSVVTPVQQLSGFQRVHLAPGESSTISFALTPDVLSLRNQNLERVMEPGEIRIMVGSSSRDIRLRGVLTVVRHP